MIHHPISIPLNDDDSRIIGNKLVVVVVVVLVAAVHQLHYSFLLACLLASVYRITTLAFLFLMMIEAHYNYS